MPLTKERKQEIVTKYGKNDKDSGNTQVQVALLTQQIEDLTQHLKKHQKDNHTRHGLLKMVSERRSLLDYLIKTDIGTYRAIIKKLEIRK
jgi:small subunit ribosomal protein S15